MADRYIYDVALVLGAGFSAAQGYPLMSGMREKVEERIGAGNENVWRQYKSWIIEADVACDLCFEELLLKAAERADVPEEDVIVDALRREARALLREVEGGIETRKGAEGNENREWIKSPYKNFAANIRSASSGPQRIAFVTFNWDLLLEALLWGAGMPWTYGWAETSPPKFPIIKAHGSLNWNASGLRSGEWCCEDKREVIKGVHYCAGRPFADIFPGGTNANFGMMLLPPGPAHAERHAAAELARQAAAVIGLSAKALVIGYSLPDYDLESQRWLTEALEGRPTEVVDSSPKTLERWQQMLGRNAGTERRFTQSTFADWATAEPDRALD